MLNDVDGCKHGKVDQKNAPIYYDHSVFGQMPTSNSKMLFRLNIFIMTSIVVLSNQMYNIDISPKIIIKSIAQKQMARSSYACSFHELNYF